MKKKSVKPKSKLKKRISLLKKVFKTAKWTADHKDMIVKGGGIAKGFLDKKKA